MSDLQTCLRKNHLSDTIEQYWTNRAPSYSDVVKYELSHENEKNWMRVITSQIPKEKYLHVLDVGTGPGFFATSLAKRDYIVTAVDFNAKMIEEAKNNAGIYKDIISFHQMDAQNLSFSDGSFDAVVTRNLTWNLEEPEMAYREWWRVLRKGGVLLNFDAGWYSYLFDKNKAKEFEKSKRNVLNAGIFDYNDYSQSDKMEDISRKLILSCSTRPEIDIEMLRKAGFKKISCDRRIGEDVWDATEKINYSSTPMFMLRADK